LLSKPRRCSRAALATAACAILTAHVLETWWLTVPDFLRPPNWLDLAAIVAVTGGALFNIDHGPGMGWLLPRLRSGHERS
jgi:hypothetical protein